MIATNIPSEYVDNATKLATLSRHTLLLGVILQPLKALVTAIEPGYTKTKDPSVECLWKFISVVFV